MHFHLVSDSILIINETENYQFDNLMMHIVSFGYIRQKIYFVGINSLYYVKTLHNEKSYVDITICTAQI